MNVIAHNLSQLKFRKISEAKKLIGTKSTSLSCLPISRVFSAWQVKSSNFQRGISKGVESFFILCFFLP